MNPPEQRIGEADERSDAEPSARRFAFFTTLWGERYADYLTNDCLPSLLAPGNLPALAGEHGHVFVVACPPADWARLQSRASFRRASAYVEFVFVPFEAPPPSVSAVDHMSVGQRAAALACHARRAIGSLLHPDMLFADGAIRHLIAKRNAGVEVLLAPALRLAEEPLRAALDLREGADRSEAIVVPPRDLARAVIASFHDEILQACATGARFSPLPNCVWWPVGPGDGALVHGFTWSPLMIDYGAVERHVVDDLCGPIADGDYVSRNFPSSRRIEYVENSDDLVFASWTPARIGRRDMRPSFAAHVPRLYDIYKRGMLRRAYRYYTAGIYRYGDHVKSAGFEKAIAIRTGDSSSAWRTAAVHARNWIDSAAGDLRGTGTRADFAVRAVERAAPIIDAFCKCRNWIQAVVERLASAVRGDAEARAWIARKITFR